MGADNLFVAVNHPPRAANQGVYQYAPTSFDRASAFAGYFSKQ